MGVQNINFNNVSTARFNGVNLTKIKLNSNTIWNYVAPSGWKTFTSNGTFVVPVGVTSVVLCMCGGGGSGSSVYDGYIYAGGGNGGQQVRTTVPVTPGERISVVIGAGGAAVATGYIATLGKAGGQSRFHAASGVRVANGGAGGILNGGYNGNGAGVSNACGGTRYDGVEVWYGYYHGSGGQRGMYGNGGKGAITGSAFGGGVGAGGGGTALSLGNSGPGGRGQVTVTWG